LRDAYELGRTGIDLNLTVLDLAIAHHEALRRALSSRRAADADELLAAAADFLAEALTAAEIVRRGYVEVREEERLQREQAALVRRLSGLLADTSLAFHGREAMLEMIQLVAEHTRELTQATACTVRVDARGLEGVSVDEGVERGSGDPELTIPLTSLDGTRLGVMELRSATSRGFSEVALALAQHVAQMTSAALDRAQLHAVGARG
jgi:GAF domain-containing protein